MKYAALIKAIQTASALFQGRAVRAVNQALVMRNWLVGAWIYEFEQHGKDRAKYGEKLLASLAMDLKQTGLKGLDMRTLPHRFRLRCCSSFRGATYRNSSQSTILGNALSLKTNACWPTGPCANSAAKRLPAL